MKDREIIEPGQLVHAPLAGYSCSVMRRLAWKFGGVAACFTEMLLPPPSTKHAQLKNATAISIKTKDRYGCSYRPPTAIAYPER